MVELEKDIDSIYDGTLWETNKDGVLDSVGLIVRLPVTWDEIGAYVVLDGEKKYVLEKTY